MCDCYYTVKYKCCGCSLKTFGFLYGWFGVIWRIVVTMFLATILSRTTHYDPNLYDIVLITLLTYIQVALITNLFFIIGIQKEKPYFLLPYTVISGMDIFFGSLLFIFVAMLLGASRSRYLLWIFVPIFLFIIVIYLFFWIKSIQLYKRMEKEVYRKEEENARIESIRQSLAY